METLPLRIARWLGSRLALAVLVAAGAVLLRAGWLAARAEVLREEERVQGILAGRREEAALEARRVELAARLAAARREAEEQRERLRLAVRVLAALDEAAGWWERWFGDPVEAERRAERRRRVAALEAEARAAREAAEARWREAAGEGATAGRRLEEVRARIAALEAGTAPWRRRLAGAWTEVRAPVAGALVLVFFGPVAGALLVYFVWGPWVARGRPLRLGADEGERPVVWSGGAVLSLALAEGERLWLRPGFLQGADDGCGRSTRWLLDPRAPFTCLAAGWQELLELRPPAGGGATVTLAGGGEEHVELALVELPAGASLVLRPTVVVAVAGAGDRPVRLRSRWCLGRWPAWVWGRFRFLVWTGPGRLVVAGRRGVRAEVLAGAGRRVRPGATLGFSPGLEWRAARAETFWSHYRGSQPLFDEHFAGRGIILVEAGPASGARTGGRWFWTNLRDALLRALGL